MVEIEGILSENITLSATDLILQITIVTMSLILPAENCFITK